MQTQAKQFEVSFINLITATTDSDSKWLDLALEAPTVFGVQCFDKGTDDFEALRGTCLAAYAQTQGGLPDAPNRKDKSAKADEVREKRKAISSAVSTYVGRMRSYWAKANDVEFEKPAQTLDKYLSRLVNSIKEGMGFKGQADVVALIEQAMIAKPEAKQSKVIKANFAPVRKAVRRAA